ncbi:MAG: hypothetical protein QG623_402 [Patescibacteria group bacterium]|nr:hypothetical protein [Patescibacteria group bacterium]
MILDDVEKLVSVSGFNDDLILVFVTNALPKSRGWSDYLR